MYIRIISLLLGLFIGFSAHSTQVETVNPVLTEHAQAIVLTGTIEGVQQANIASQQAGLIAAIAVEAGDEVTKGQVLLTLDDTLAKLNLTQAQAGLKAAKVALNEAERLYQEVLALSKQKVVAETLISRRNADVAAANANLSELQARFAVAKEQLNRHTVYAPFAGVVANRMVNVGEWVSQSSGLFNLLDSHLRLRVAVPQQYFNQLQDAKNLTVMVKLDAAGASVNGTINRIVKAIDSQSRTFTAFVDLPLNQANTSGIAAGMSATATINLTQKGEQIVWLPASAIKQHPDGGASVFTVKNSKAQRVLVAVVDKSDKDDGKVAVSGIDGKYPVIATGVELLKTGAAVSVKP